MSSHPIRVLIADDSEAARSAIAALLQQAPDISVVGQAKDGAEAVRLAEQLRPHVITMDVQMPKMSGLEAVEAIMSRCPARIVMVCSVDGREVDISFRAMALGALTLIAKPSGQPETVRTFGRKLVEEVRLMAEVPVVGRRVKHAHDRAAPQTDRSVDAFALVSSTGGPPALATVMKDLPVNLPIPIVVAQHMAPGFTAGLVRWLQSVVRLKVELAENGAPMRAGHVYLPPDNHDLEVAPQQVLRVSRSSGTGHCPSGDRLLQSMAEVYGKRAGAAVLTGMGEDGARGLLCIYEAGGFTAAQDEASSVVYGMPNVATKLGAARTVCDLEGLSKLIRELCASPSASTAR